MIGVIQMSPRRWIAVLIFTACGAFVSGWYAEYMRVGNASLGIQRNPVNNGQSPGATLDCKANTLADNWQTVQTFDYQPLKTLYTAAWEFCPGNIQGQRVRVMDANFLNVFYKYEDDEIVRVEQIELVGNRVPQLLIVTGSSGTNDRINWHVLSEVNGQLQEWKWPNYDAPASELLGPDEDFCCKEWNFHLRGHDIVLVRGIYHKGEDGNCCPSRGGVIVRLKPIENGFKLDGVQRVSRPEYDRWKSQPFCSQCTLAGP